MVILARRTDEGKVQSEDTTGKAQSIVTGTSFVIQTQPAGKGAQASLYFGRWPTFEIGRLCSLFVLSSRWLISTQSFSPGTRTHGAVYRWFDLIPDQVDCSVGVEKVRAAWMRAAEVVKMPAVQIRRVRR